MNKRSRIALVVLLISGFVMVAAALDGNFGRTVAMFTAIMLISGVIFVVEG